MQRRALLIPDGKGFTECEDLNETTDCTQALHFSSFSRSISLDFFRKICIEGGKWKIQLQIESVIVVNDGR